MPFDRLEDRTVLSNVLNPVRTIADEILVQYRPEANVQVRAANRANAGFGLLDEIESAQRLDMGHGMIELVQVPAGMSTDSALAWLANQPGVEYAEPNQILTISAIPNDPAYTNGSLWGMYGSDSPSTIGPAGTTNTFGIHAENAWNANYTGSRSVYVGIIDTGVQISHPDLAPNVWVNPYDPPDGIDNDGNGYVDDSNGWDFANNDRSVYDTTSDSHGTHVAGTIGAAGGNGVGVTGVNWQVTMIVAKFISGNSGTTANAIRAIDYVTDLKLRHGLDIVATNNSWGGGGYSTAMHAAILRAAKADILFVAAAGNNSANIDSYAFYPASYSSLVSVGSTTAASYESVISVASITSTGGLSGFSNYGVGRVDIGAPGSNISSTVPVNSYASYNGTSMAAPHVTGSIALLKSVRTEATAAQLRSAILASATPTTSLSGRVATGGRLNVFAAINHSSWNQSPPQLPTVNIADATNSEGNSDQSLMVFTVTLSAASAQPVTVSYTTQNGTAIAGSDYVAKSGSLVIPAGATSGSISVSVLGDSLFEGDESFGVTLVSATNATIGDGTATGTILNDDRKPGLSILDASRVEGNSGLSDMVFTVTMTNAADAPVTVQYATSNISAAAGSDFVATVGTLTIPAGATSATIAVPIVGDSDFEADETFRVTLSNPSANATITAPYATGTIVNDDSSVLPVVSIASASRPEGHSGTAIVEFAVTLNTVANSAVTVSYATSGGTATAGVDFAQTAGTITIPAGATSAIIPVTIYGDHVYEADETFTVTLGSATGASIATPTATGTILNDDPVPALSIASVSQTEGQSGTSLLVFTVALSNASSSPVTVAYATANATATAGSDYGAASGTLTIPAGATSAIIPVTIYGDIVHESDETFTLSLGSATGASIATPTATGTILNDDPVPVITIASAGRAEGQSGSANLIFTVALSSPSSTPVTVAYATSDGSATAGSDYAATAGTITIPAGATSAIIPVTIYGDIVHESDETFTLSLGSATGASIATPAATGTIFDDDPVPAISIASASRVEGDSGLANMVFIVTLSNPSSTPVSVAYATADGSATAGADYVSTAGTVTFAPGATSATIEVPIVGDTEVESNETFALILSSPAGATIASATATGTIVNDDAASLELTIEDARILEGDSGWSTMEFVVSLSGPASFPVTMQFETIDGTASSRGNTGDFQSLLGFLTIPAGQTSVSISVRVKGDRTWEADETFDLKLSNVTPGVTVMRDQAVGTILNDDPLSNGGTRGGNGGFSFEASFATHPVEIIAAPLPELDFVLGEWVSKPKKPTTES